MTPGQVASERAMSLALQLDAALGEVRDVVGDIDDLDFAQRHLARLTKALGRASGYIDRCAATTSLRP